MAIPNHHIDNFETLVQAAIYKQLVLVECRDRASQALVYVICTVEVRNGEYQITPFAKMFNSDPFSEVDPPDLQQEESK